jgi:microcystin-dependent protein
VSEPFLGEIKMFAYGQAPPGWTPCEGQLLPINQNQALYTLYGTQFGGDGRTTFGVPDLRDRVPVAAGHEYVNGSTGGEATHVLTEAEIPAHSHATTVNASEATTQTPSGGTLLAASTPGQAYGPPEGLAAMAPNAVGSAGGDTGHENMQPFLALAYFVATTGAFPSRN